jgi:arginyl-tRNA--protein-N-Asp/Glu arginylyltransferase
MYQMRGMRVLAQEFSRTTDQRRVARKTQALGKVEYVVRPLSETKLDDDFYSFWLTYFRFRFGKYSMPKDRLVALLTSGWVTHVAECRVNGKRAALMLERHDGNMAHVFYQAYAKEYERHNLGIEFYIELIERAKTEGKRYVYFGASYGSWMRYKTNFAPLEYWDGATWVRDDTGKKLKALLFEGLTLVPYADRFRSKRDPFYPSPSIGPLQREAEFLQMLFDGAPRLALLMFGVPVILIAIAFFMTALD